MAFRSLRTVGAAGRAAVLLGLGNAAVSAYWLFGGTALLDTVSGDIERWGRERGPSVLAALAFVVLVKTAVAVAPLVDVDKPWKRWVQWIERLAAWVLVGYGGLLTAVGLLVQSGVIKASDGADTSALAWHTYFWDPWFLLWGGALMVHLRQARPDLERHAAASLAPPQPRVDRQLSRVTLGPELARASADTPGHYERHYRAVVASCRNASALRPDARTAQRAPGFVEGFGFLLKHGNI